MIPLFRIALFVAVAGAVTMALLPVPPHLPVDRFGDKFEHMLAFATIALLAALAYPTWPLPRIAERLSFLGALIEVAQSIPALHRDCDIRDWVADTVAICVTLGLVAIARAATSSTDAARASRAASAASASAYRSPAE